jgi:hypothetical protein
LRPEASFDDMVCDRHAGTRAFVPGAPPVGVPLRTVPTSAEAKDAYGCLCSFNCDCGDGYDIGTVAGRHLGRRIPGAPKSLTFGHGARGWLLMIVPDHDPVIVSMDESIDDGRPVNDPWSAIEPTHPSAV